MVIKNNTILYFSGTGNSLQVAKDISNKLIGFDLLKITSLRNEEKIVVEAKALGIIFPVYYARLPLVVEEVLRKIELNKDVYIYAIATYGGAPATVLKKLTSMLQNYGGTLNSGFLLRMPKNNVFGYNMNPVGREDLIFKREKEKVEKICDIVRERRNNKCETSKIVIDAIIDKIFIKTTNKIMKDLYMEDTKFWVNKNCSGCKLCEKICSVKNIEFNIKPIWKHHCEHCTACIQYCPTEAIQWGNKSTRRKRYKNPFIKITELIE